MPEVGNETIRVVTHLIGLERRIPVLFLLYTIFPNPLRLSVDTLHAPIVEPEEVRELTRGGARGGRGVPALLHRAGDADPRVPALAGRAAARGALRSTTSGASAARTPTTSTCEPWRLLGTNVAETVRARAARPFYDDLEGVRPFVYFPLHVTDDYKIRKVIPHTEDQASLVEQVADALPPGYDLVLKEHPMSVGRNSLALLRRLRSASERPARGAAHLLARADPPRRGGSP